MRSSCIKKVIGITVSSAIIVSSVPFVTFAADKHIRGNSDGYEYEMWNQSDIGDVSYEYEAGSFTCSWADVENLIALMGKSYDDQRKNYKAFDDVSFSYDIEFTPHGNAFYGAYGWTRNPLVEYYIVDGWGSWRPCASSNSELLGTTIVNGNEYEVFKTNRYNQPGLDGPNTFSQYWSVRTKSDSKNNTTNHVNGCIDVAKHFDSWEAMGLDTSGTLYEAAFNVEAYRSSGSVRLNSIKIGEGKDNTPLTVYSNKYYNNEQSKYADAGYFFMYNFDCYLDDWSPRDNELLKRSSYSYEGANAMFVTDRSASWQGPSIYLGSEKYTPGETYSFGAFVMQDSRESADFEIVLQYLNSDGKFRYDTIAETKAEKGQWSELSNYSYTIPEGAKQLTLYIDTPGYTGDFSVDNAYAGKKDTPPFYINDNEVTRNQRGDVNRDGVVDVYDLILLRKTVIQLSAKSDIPPVNSDVNGDGSVNVADIVSLQKFLLGADKSDEQETATATATAASTTYTTSLTTTTEDNSQTTAAQTSAAGYKHITQEKAKEMMQADDGHVIVDVRRQDEYDSGHIPDAILIPNESIGTEQPKELPDPDQIILVYCRSGRRSAEAAQKLADMGYTHIYEFGGIIDWTGEVVTN